MSTGATTRPPASAPAAASAPSAVAPASGLGLVPAVALAVACGVALVAVADALSRTGRPHAELVLWLGLGAIFLPVLLRVAAPSADRTERWVLVLVLGVAFYLVKVLRDPFAFTYADELVHQHNALEILGSGRLFGENPILPVTPAYPGLEAVTAALASLTGLSSFVAGLVVIGVARCVLVLAVFLLVEEVSASSRVAGVAAALYATSPHFVFFTAQFSYESLGLPLALVALLAAVRGWPAGGRLRGWAAAERMHRGWVAVAVLATLAVVATHHMTSYALVAALLGLCLLSLPLRGLRLRSPWPLLAVAAAAIAAWLFVVADRTVGYLSPVLSEAFRATLRTASGEAPPRRLFSGGGGGAPSSPGWEHAVAIAGAVVLVAALPFGLWLVWRRLRASPPALLLALGAIAYVGTLALRLAPGAWETGVRASEFLFVGVAFVLALGAVQALDGRRARRVPLAATVVAAALGGLLLTGGVIGASSPQGRVAQPYRVVVAGATLDPPVVAAARWTRRALGPGQRIAAEEADARELLVEGRQHAIAGTNPPIVTVLRSPSLEPWQRRLLRRERIRYVAVDARRSSADVTLGYFFPRRALGPAERFPAAAVSKFDRAGARRVYDDGTFVIYDVRGLR